jgi:hypothetical protein
MITNDNFFSIDYAKNYMIKVKEHYIELGENYILNNEFNKHQKIKDFDDEYFINLIAKLEKQTYPSNEDISKYIASNKIEKKHWKEQEIIQLKNFYNSYYDVKLMNTLFKDYKYNMISTLKIYKNEIIKSAVDCVSFNIQNEFNSEEEYSKSNFIRTDNELINECISDKKIHTIYMNITNSWNEFTRAEIEDNVLNGILTALKENQTFTNEKIELTNKFIGVEVATCTFNKIKEKYPNYSEFNYGFYEINLPEVKNDFDNIKESCLNKSLNKWNKQN